MERFLFLLTLILLPLLGGSALVWYLAYGSEARPPVEASVAGLSGDATVAWTTDGVAVIEAASEADRYAALGFAHGSRHGWAVALWRQVAVGELARWFGDDLLPLDRLTLRLGLPTTARAAYEALSDEDRALLDAYARGLNAALTDRSAHLPNEFTLLDLTPTPWEPWHTLALEKLFAWLATTPVPADSLAPPGADLRAFFTADHRLRGWLHVHGFDQSRAWAVRDTAGTFFDQELVYGASALPAFQEVVFPLAGGDTLRGVTFPGTPFMPAGQNAEYAWSLLPSSPLTAVRALVDTLDAPLSHFRVVGRDAAEYLLQARRSRSALYLDAQPAPTGTLLPDSVRTAADSVWALRWNGFDVTSDWPAWRALANGSPQPFQLLRGDGLLVRRNGAIEVIGRPLLVRPLPSGVFITNSPRARYAGAHLDSLLRASPRSAFEALSQNPYSRWAARAAPPLVASVEVIDQRGARMEEALAYLRNWDFNFDRSSIGASIFDRWVRFYRDSTGSMPGLLPPDPDSLSLLGEHVLRYRTLDRTLDEMTAEYGGDLRQWRWERVQPHDLYFPVWSADGSRPATGLGTTRYAPVAFPASGHPTALASGPSVFLDELPAPARWRASLRTDAWDGLTVRRRRLEMDRALGRYLISDRPPAPFRLGGTTQLVHQTTLRP